MTKWLEHLEIGVFWLLLSGSAAGQLLLLLLLVAE
jgi:hypothetical protein